MFWEVTPCNLVDAHRRLGGNYWLNLQSRRVSRQSKLQAVLFDDRYLLPRQL
jgi:hypothetical protein